MRKQKNQNQGLSVTKIFATIGIVSVILFLLAASPVIFKKPVPYSFKSYTKLDNPNKFTSDIYLGDGMLYNDYDNVMLPAVREVYDELGIQLYFIALDMPENVTTKEEVKKYANDWINNAIDTDYAIYSLSVEYPADVSYKEQDYDLVIYDEVYYGSEVEHWMTAEIMNIYNKAYNRYYGSMTEFYSIEECIAFGLALTAERIMHPVLSIAKLIGKLLVIGAIIAVIILLIKKHLDRKHLERVLATPIKDLVAEHAEEVSDRYE